MMVSYSEQPLEENAFEFPSLVQQEVGSETDIVIDGGSTENPIQLNGSLLKQPVQSGSPNDTTPCAPPHSPFETGVRRNRGTSLLKAVSVTRQDQLTPKATYMYKLAAKFKRESRILSKKACSFRKRLKMAEEMCNVQCFQELAAHVDDVTYQFILSQVRTQRLKPRGRRFSLDDKILALSLYKHSGKAYRLLSRIFSLPSRKTIMKLLSGIPFNTGINKRVMEHLEKSVSKLSELDRHCCLVFDEMAVEPGLQYNLSSDVIHGFEDFGVDDRCTKFADHVLVFMVRGLRKKWKQPVAFFFCDSTTKTAPLCKIIKEVIRSVRLCGLKVAATVCDQGSSNQAAINTLLKETNEYCLRNNIENTYVGFLVDDEEVMPLYDVCHLLKGMRNNLLTKDITFIWKTDIQKASWKHIIQFYQLDAGDDDVKMCPKLTDQHVIPEKIKKMKVSYCAQVFSQRVSAAMRMLAKDGKYVPDLAVEAADTADFLLFMDKLFDSVNGAVVKPKKGKYLRCAVTSNSPHVDFWNDAINVLRSIKCYDNKGKVSVPPSVKNWIFTLRSLKYLWQKLCKCGFEFLSVRSLNQDPLENFFGCVRSHGCRNVNPTCSSFISSFKSLLLNNFMSPNSLGSNCKEDTSTGALDTLRCFVTGELEVGFLQNDSQTESAAVSVLTHKLQDHAGTTRFEMADDEPRVKKNEIAAAVKVYISGYLVRQIMNSCKGCKTCYAELSSTGGRKEDFMIAARAYSPKALCYPNTQFSMAFNQIAHIVVSNLPVVAHHSGVLKHLTVEVQKLVDLSFLSCKEHDTKKRLVFLAVKMMIHTWCKNVNRILAGKNVHHSQLNANFFGDTVKQLAYKRYVKYKHK